MSLFGGQDFKPLQSPHSFSRKVYLPMLILTIQGCLVFVGDAVVSRAVFKREDVINLLFIMMFMIDESRDKNGCSLCVYVIVAHGH